MKAILCTRYGYPEELTIAEVDESPISESQVRISIKAAGINFADVLKIAGKYQEKPSLPWVPGTEIAGVISEIGLGVTNLSVGQRVMGVSDIRGGGFADSIVLSAERVLPLPQKVSYEQAAAIPVIYGTAMFALKERANLAKKNTLLVLGAAGGVGSAAIEVGKALGALVIAAASTEEKRKLALDSGADWVIDYTNSNWHEQIKTICRGERVDVIFDPVGGAAFTEAERCIGWEGKYLIVGFASGEIPTVPLNKPLVKGYDLLGIRYDVWRDKNWLKAKRHLQEIISLSEKKEIKPRVIETFPMHLAREALKHIADRAIIGKIILTNNT